jgi:hypothetical protein
MLKENGSVQEVSMAVIKSILRLLGWLLTMIAQVIASNITVFIFSLLFGWMVIDTHLEWFVLLFIVWFAYVLGVNLAGQAALRLTWKSVRPLTRERIIGSAIGAMIPLLALFLLGLTVPFGNTGSEFYDLVTDNWQPILAQASMFATVLGFYIPALIIPKPKPVVDA